MGGSSIEHPADPEGWNETLQYLIQQGTDRKAHEYAFIIEGQPIPFEDVYAPFVEWTEQKLQRREPSTSSMFTATAIASIDRILLVKIAGLCSEALAVEFAAFRQRRSEGSYPSFVAELWRSGYLDHYFSQYAALGPLLGTLLTWWIERISTLHQRLQKDLTEITTVFNKGCSPGQVTHVVAGEDDSFRRDQSPFLITFENGLRVVYKPRDVSPERAWSRLQHWINTQRSGITFRPLDVIEREGYGWMEYQLYEPCRDRAELANYYRNSGMLLALVYVLGGTDCHFKNIIVNGTRPQLVDLETVVRPELPTNRMNSSGRGWSVLRAGLLPKWEAIGHDGEQIDVSGLGCQTEQQIGYLHCRWSEVNTDRMAFKHAPMMLRPNNNRPFPSSTLTAADHAVEVVGGFRDMYRLLLDFQEILLLPEGPLSGFRTCRVRYLVRKCADYGNLLMSSTRPENLRSHRTLNQHVKTLEGIRLNRIFEYEQRAIKQWSMPYFSIGADQTDAVSGDGTVIEDCVSQTGYARLAAQVSSLSEDDLKRQSRLIQASLDVRFPGNDKMGESGLQSLMLLRLAET